MYRAPHPLGEERAADESYDNGECGADEGVTDGDGRFNFGDVTPGRYVINAALLQIETESGALTRNFRIATSSIRLVEVREGPVEITLTVLEDVEPKGR